MEGIYCEWSQLVSRFYSLLSKFWKLSLVLPVYHIPDMISVYRIYTVHTVYGISHTVYGWNSISIKLCLRPFLWHWRPFHSKLSHNILEPPLSKPMSLIGLWKTEQNSRLNMPARSWVKTFTVEKFRWVGNDSGNRNPNVH